MTDTSPHAASTVGSGPTITTTVGPIAYLKRPEASLLIVEFPVLVLAEQRDSDGR